MAPQAATRVAYDPAFTIPWELIRQVDPDSLLEGTWVPLARAGKIVHVLTDDPACPATVAAVRRAFPGHALRLYLGSREDISRFIGSIDRAQGRDGSLTPALSLLVRKMVSLERRTVYG